MKIKKLALIVLITIFVFSLSGCVKEDIRLSINTDINEYTTSMSSVPGFALIAQFSRDLKNKNYKFHWVTEQGTFLTWHDEGKGRIDDLGNNIKTNVHKVYWSVDPDEEINETSFKIYLTVEEVETSKVMYKTSIQIDQKKKGYFSIKE